MESSDITQIDVFCIPEVFAKRASKPIAIFCIPEVLAARVFTQIAVFSDPILLDFKAPDQMATFRYPVELAISVASQRPRLLPVEKYPTRILFLLKMRS